MRRRAWYKAAEYKQPFEAKKLGDGSTVECGELREEPGFLLLKRTYPWGFEQDIVFSVLPNGETKYHKVGDGPERPQRRPEDEPGHPEFTVPHFRGAVPGQGITNTYDEATRKDYAQSGQFEEEYDRLKISRQMASDPSTRHMTAPGGKYNGSMGSVEAFDASSGGVPPLPRRG
jgi:hypothetical protein